MFYSQSSVDDMSIDELVSAIKRNAYSVENRIEDPADAMDYCYALTFLVESLRHRIEAVLEDVE